MKTNWTNSTITLLAAFLIGIGGGYIIKACMDAPPQYFHYIHVAYEAGDKVQIVKSFPNDSNISKIGTVVGGSYWKAANNKEYAYYFVSFDPSQNSWHGYTEEELRLVMPR